MRLISYHLGGVILVLMLLVLQYGLSASLCVCVCVCGKITPFMQVVVVREIRTCHMAIRCQRPPEDPCKKA